MIDRKEIAAAFEETAALLELKGENPFKVKAYTQAARAILSVPGDLADLVTTGRVASVKGFGRTLAGHVAELVTTGRLGLLVELRNHFPAGVLEMMQVPGLGPKKVKALYEDLGIKSLGELEYACRENRLVTLKGFGAKTQAKVLQGLEALKKYRGRHLWAEVEHTALDLAAGLAGCPEVGRVELAGSFRRRKEIVKDLDLVAVSQSPAGAVECLEGLDLVEALTGGAETKFSFRLKTGLNADLRLVPAESFAFAWHHFTGSTEHNTQMRQRAKTRGFKLNEYGLFDQAGRNVSPGIVLDETGVFNLLDLPFIPPELREGLGEIEAAAAGRLPRLIEDKDIRGLFHVHSNYSDGGLTLADLIRHARALGYEYLGLSDHSRGAAYAGGLDLPALDRQWAEVLELRQGNPDFGLFWGIESDILPDGSLDYPPQVLARFDFILASVHSHFSLTEKEMTARLVKAVQNPFTTILGHPTGRLLLAREPYALDLPAVLAAAAEHGVAVEINANPHRLDLDWREMRRAKDLGLKTIICPDAHSASGLQDARYGVNAARKGWLTQEDVINSLSRMEMARFLEARKRKAGAG
ncbi:MAG: DNA polymerase/3'-5' exonuclease PolX [Thermodesulfobacteriota bacterium]